MTLDPFLESCVPLCKAISVGGWYIFFVFMINRAGYWGFGGGEGTRIRVTEEETEKPKKSAIPQAKKEEVGNREKKF